LRETNLFGTHKIMFYCKIYHLWRTA